VLIESHQLEVIYPDVSAHCGSIRIVHKKISPTPTVNADFINSNILKAAINPLFVFPVSPAKPVTPLNFSVSVFSRFDRLKAKRNIRQVKSF
jgi:hypothetical protein